jgi:uncharacterized protein YutE (UPF0331/DUF86 family)
MLEAYLGTLREVVSPLRNVEQLTSDPAKFLATQRFLQICVQILIDIALKIVSLAKLKTQKSTASWRISLRSREC